MEIRPVGAGLFHADGLTDMKKLTVAFRNFALRAKTRVYVKHIMTENITLLKGHVEKQENTF